MRRTYICESNQGKNRHIEKMVLDSSLNNWLKKAKVDEKDGYVVNVNFRYRTKEEVIMTDYFAYHLTNGHNLKLTLATNKK